MKEAKETTNDKLTCKTKELIERREQMRKEKDPSPQQKNETAEIKKIVKKEIKKDCRNYAERIVKEIIEETGSTRKMKRELPRGTKLLTGMKNKEGKW